MEEIRNPENVQEIRPGDLRTSSTSLNGESGPFSSSSGSYEDEQREIDDFLMGDFHLKEYKHHEPIAAKMAV